MKLISYDQALAELHKLVPTTSIRRSESVSILDSVGRALAKPIYASDSNPRFDNSAVDGYAVACADDAEKGTRLEVIGEVRAGSSTSGSIRGGAAVRIFTGAPVPSNTYAVVMQEDVVRNGDTIVLGSTAEAAANVRFTGHDFKKGEQLLSPGETLRSGHVALIGAQGEESVQVFTRVAVEILCTGDEIVAWDRKPTPTQVRDSNSPMLTALLNDDGHSVISLTHIADSLEATTSALRTAAGRSEVVLISGGASVGEYDYVRRAVEELGTVSFHGVSVRPGKPFLAGKVKDTVVFGLPGNPGSVFVGYHIFVRDTLRRIGSHARSAMRWTTARFEAGQPYGRDDFVRCRLEFNDNLLFAYSCDVQGSFGLRSLAMAEAIVRVPKGASGLADYPALLL